VSVFACAVLPLLITDQETSLHCYCPPYGAEPGRFRP